MKLLIDMNLSPRWVSRLTDAGMEAAHWSSLGAANATDMEIMEFARRHGYVVLTHDLDFGAILAATQGAGPSVVQIRGLEVSPEGIGTALVLALRQMENELAEGALLTLDAKRSRLRILPL